MVKSTLYELLKIGLTEGESKVYLALHETGSSTVGPIVKQSKVAYSNIYDILDRLIEKGLVSYIIKNKTKYFQAAPPLNLLEYLDKREDEIHSQKKALESIMPELEKIQKFIPQQDAEIFLGKKGIKTAYQKFLSDMGKNDEDLFFYIHEKEYAEDADTFYFSVQDLIKIPNRGITNENYRNSPFIKKAKFLNVRYVDFPIPGNIEVCKNKILLISWKKPIIAVLISSESLADNLRNYFNSVWSKAKK